MQILSEFFIWEWLRGTKQDWNYIQEYVSNILSSTLFNYPSFYYNYYLWFNYPSFYYNCPLHAPILMPKTNANYKVASQWIKLYNIWYIHRMRQLQLRKCLSYGTIAFNLLILRAQTTLHNMTETVGKVLKPHYLIWQGLQENIWQKSQSHYITY